MVNLSVVTLKWDNAIYNSMNDMKKGVIFVHPTRRETTLYTCRNEFHSGFEHSCTLVSHVKI